MRVTLLDTQPPVWRQVLVPFDIPLVLLHRTLLTVMGWQGYHLHRFLCGDVRYGIPDTEYPDDTVSYDDLTLRDVAPEVGSTVLYEYDFGDSWQHELVVEYLRPLTPELRAPHCRAGARACPPEDVGGAEGYATMVEVLTTRPNSPEAEEYDAWLGYRFDPAAFDKPRINEELRRLAASDVRFWVLYPDDRLSS